MTITIDDQRRSLRNKQTIRYYSMHPRMWIFLAFVSGFVFLPLICLTWVDFDCRTLKDTIRSVFYAIHLDFFVVLLAIYVALGYPWRDYDPRLANWIAGPGLSQGCGAQLAGAVKTAPVMIVFAGTPLITLVIAKEEHSWVALVSIMSYSFLGLCLDQIMLPRNSLGLNRYTIGAGHACILYNYGLTLRAIIPATILALFTVFVIFIDVHQHQYTKHTNKVVDHGPNPDTEDDIEVEHYLLCLDTETEPKNKFVIKKKEEIQIRKDAGELISNKFPKYASDLSYVDVEFKRRFYKLRKKVIRVDLSRLTPNARFVAKECIDTFLPSLHDATAHNTITYFMQAYRDHRTSNNFIHFLNAVRNTNIEAKIIIKDKDNDVSTSKETDSQC